MRGDTGTGKNSTVKGKKMVRPPDGSVRWRARWPGRGRAGLAPAPRFGASARRRRAGDATRERTSARRVGARADPPPHLVTLRERGRQPGGTEAGGPFVGASLRSAAYDARPHRERHRHRPRHPRREDASGTCLRGPRDLQSAARAHLRPYVALRGARRPREGRRTGLSIHAPARRPRGAAPLDPRCDRSHPRRAGFVHVGEYLAHG